MPIEIRKLVSQQEYCSAARRVWELVKDDQAIQGDIGSEYVELSYQEAGSRKGYQCPQGAADAALALLAAGHVLTKINKNAMIGFVSGFLMDGGLATFRTRDGKAVVREEVLRADLPKAAPASVPKPAPEPVTKAAGPKPSRTAPLAAKPAASPVVKPMPRVLSSQPEPTGAPVAPKPLPRVLSSKPGVAPVELEPPKVLHRREPAGPNEQFCASVVMSHLLVSISQLGALDTDPGHEGRLERLNVLLSEYQSVSRSRISNWPPLT